MDVGLPTLNGIEAARRIRKLSTKSKILFVSQESSSDVVQEAFCIGALGYVIKTHAVAALDAVHQGVPFVSSGLSGNVSELSYTQAPNRLHADEVLASPAEGD